MPRLVHLSITPMLCAPVLAWLFLTLLREAPVPTVCVLFALVVAGTWWASLARLKRIERTTTPQPPAAPESTATPNTTKPVAVAGS